MKKYLVVLFALIGFGLILIYQTVQHNLQYSEETHLKTTSSIRNLKLIDNNINITLFEIRHQGKSLFAQLEQAQSEFDTEFERLRSDLLGAEINKSQALATTIQQLVPSLERKQQSIMDFISKNETLTESNNEFLSASAANSDFRNLVKNLSIGEEVNTLTINFYQFLRDGNEENKSKLNDSIAYVGVLIESSSEDDQALVFGYIKTLSDVIIGSAEAQSLFEQSVSAETTQYLNDLEAAYSRYRNEVLVKSESLQVFSAIYGVVLLAILLFFAYLLWKNYQNLEQEVVDRTAEIAQAYDDLKESQEQLIQKEKMASLGEMVAGIAHEINTPLGYVNSNIDAIKANVKEISEVLIGLDKIYQEAISPKQNSQRISNYLSTTIKNYLEIKNEDIHGENIQLLNDSSYGIEEISKLVVSLKDFARLDRKSSTEIDVHECIESALTIAVNHIKENHVAIVRDYGSLPNISCIPSKLNQLFLNVITNACQSMSQNGGNLDIKTHLNGSGIVIVFSDQGTGMDDNTIQKMFDPFFTSKPIGEGTGLGMSIAYKIIQAHKGDIQVSSVLGEGSSIAIQLPVNI
ncbi:MAG: ATP-binding protein [Pseudomonadota bacterium]